MNRTEAKVSGVEQNGTPTGSEASARRGHSYQAKLMYEHDVDVELTESGPTIQQQQAYERFWKLFIERVVRERKPEKSL